MDELQSKIVHFLQAFSPILFLPSFHNPWIVVHVPKMKITAIHAPGHTRGSTMFTINDEILISGDVLFAGSIGRTDLPSGSHEAMVKTLKTRVLPLSDELRVLPGHGPETTIKFERKNNPYLKELRV